ncbi:trypsin-like peptidase domain-containing protein [Oscillospiraceae bacterium CM]|nr:trypsin-like peptidase domain-containing protein [Oscillospiraceae bacterium CM]
MKKRVATIILSLLLIVTILPVTVLAGTLSNFTKVNTYSSGQFTDVSNQWFAPYVQTAYEYGLVNGSSPTTFSPGNNLTIAEAIKLAACLHSIYNTGSANFPSGSPWYQPYVDYALSNDIIPVSYPNYKANATRADFAVILAAALPDEALMAKNQIDDNAIPDVSVTYSYGPAVYKLYRAGVLAGSDSAGTFYPGSFITRDAVAAIVTRMASTDFRQSLTLTENELTATEISKLCCPAVFYIEVYDSTGKVSGCASGFFISSSGLAVTNFHVISRASSAKIVTKDGGIYNVSGVYDYSETNDLALLQISGSGFPYLNLGNSDTAATGSTIYAIGYPLGVDQTFSKGTITNAAHLIDGVSYIMIDASISHGSSGGALINTAGEVIGVTSGGYEDGQNLNLAVPINLVNNMKQTSTVPLSTVASSTSALKVTASPAAVTINKGSKTTVTLTASSGNFDSIAYQIGNYSIVACAWGDWSGNSIPLTFTGLAPGSTAVIIGLLDENDNALATTSINVTVVGSGTSTAYYSGYYPAPDYGAYVNCAPYYQNYDPSTDSEFFAYRISDLTVDSHYAIDGYFDLLSDNGFHYFSSFYDDYGDLVYVFRNSSYGLDVYYSIGEFYSSNCVLIFVVPI